MFQNVLQQVILLLSDVQSRSAEYDVGWWSTFHYVPLPSIWLHRFGTIYYRLYGIKYKYHVVAVLYPQSCIHLHLDNSQFPSQLLSSLSSVLSSEPWSLNHWTFAFTDPQSYSRWVAKSRQALDRFGQWHWGNWGWKDWKEQYGWARSV